MDRLLASFRTSYTPSQYLSIEESMVSYKRRLSFIQYLPKIKQVGDEGVCVDRGRKWLHMGMEVVQEEGQREVGLAHQVLLDDERLQNKGYVVVMDSYYSSPQLFKDLITRGFVACVTVRRDRKRLPHCVQESKLQKGDVASNVDDSVLTLKWQDKQDVLMLSTYHGTEMMKNRRAVPALPMVVWRRWRSHFSPLRPCHCEQSHPVQSQHEVPSDSAGV